MELSEAVRCERLTALKALLDKLAAALDDTESARDIPPLSKQLREVMAEIEAIEKENEEPDDRAPTMLELIRRRHSA